MIELLKEFLLFGVVEVFILLMFCKNVGKVKEIKYWHGFILCVISFCLGYMNTIIPFTKEVGMVVMLIVYIFIITEDINFKIPFISFVYMLTIEVLMSVVFTCIFGRDFSFISLSNIDKFLFFIPIRILEIVTIIVYKNKRRVLLWVGSFLEKLKKLKKQK